MSERVVNNWLLGKEAKKRTKLDRKEKREMCESPVSGTYIVKNREEKKGQDNRPKICSIAASFIKITPQMKAKLAKIPNKIGPYECKLCKVVFKDAIELALHDCPCFVHIDYKFPFKT